jgi:virulence factor Mce-like protein
MSTRRLATLGLALLLVAAGSVYGVLSAFSGKYSSYDVVYADVPASGTGISAQSVVIFRDLTVGEVGALGRQLPHGLLRVELHIDPDDLDAIPAGVTADVEIATVFGTQGINLVPPSRPRAGHLDVDETIPSVGLSKTTTLQGDATDLDNLLNALHPAAIDATLSAVADALRNQGPALGSTIDQVATYLNEMLPELPGIESDLRLLGPVSNQLATAAPSIISTLANGSVTAQTITAQSAQLHQLLAGATPTANNLTGLLNATGPSFEDLVANAAPLLGDIAANPNEVAQTLSGFDAWSKAFAAAETQGPFLSFSGDLYITGAAQVVAAGLGVPGTGALVEQGLGPQYFNPTTYTSADCPTYQGEAGPNCPTGTAASAEPNAKGSAVEATPAQERAAVKIATGLNKGKAPASPAVATLLLEPLLVHLSGHA